MPRTIVLCLGGLTIGLVEQWAEKRWFPHLSAVFQSAAGGRLETHPVPYEPSILESAFTGATPGDHGVFSMWRMRERSVAEVPRVIERDDRSAPYLWEWPEFAGRRAVVVNVIGSHPPRPMPGIIVTYPFQQTTRCAWPKSVLPALIESGTPMAHDVCVFFREGADRRAFEAAVTRVEQLRLAALATLLSEKADLFVCNLTIADRLSHFLFDEVTPGSPMADEDTALWRAHGLLDNVVRDLLAELGADDHLLVFTDLGFGPLRKFISVNDLLARHGFYAEGAPTIPDPARCLAFETVQGSHGLVVSRRDRFADGLLGDPAAERIEAEIADMLREARDEDTGRPLFRTVVRGCELYPGRRAADAPDIVFLPDDEACQPLGHPYWARHVSRHCQTGWHRAEAAWGLVGPRAARLGRRTLAVGGLARVLADLLDLDAPDLCRDGAALHPGE